MKKQFILTSFLFAFIFNFSQAQKTTQSEAKIWEENITLPTYLIGKDDKNPRFFFGKSYQGAQGRIYPYNSMQVLTDVKVDKTYKTINLENDFLRINITPELGGKLFSAMDKTNNYDFVYRQTVIKPILIGMLGAWVSGGIEWNVFHHHRNTSFLPVDYTYVENPDGSVTAWIGETERRHRMKWRIGITIYPDKSYIEAKMIAQNTTPVVHSMLYFANNGVHSGEDYQVIFPPSTEWVTEHAKRGYAGWPIAHETFDDIDFEALGKELGTNGTDISLWKNNISQISFFAYNYKDDWVAGYDHGKDAGTCVLGEHHTAPGKKFWTTGAGHQGQVWDALLTDTDGPELELMIGGYSDNQPDYSWIQPGETKTVTHYFYPLKNMMGGVKKANKDAAVNFEIEKKNKAKIAFNTTSKKTNARVKLLNGEETIFEETINITPGNAYNKTVDLPENVNSDDLIVSLITKEGKELISYCPKKTSPGAFPGYTYEGDVDKGIRAPMPEKVESPKPPAEIESMEMLYLSGMRLEQFHNATMNPIPYYEEALKRDPGDLRVNTALGINLFKKFEFEKSKKHLENAVKRACWNYSRPRDGEPFYYLGIVNKITGNHKEAIDNLYASEWDYSFNSSAHYMLAEIYCLKKEYNKALTHLDRSLTGNTQNLKALNLKSAVMRKTGNASGAEKLAKNTISNDILDFRARNELYLSLLEQDKNEDAEEALKTLKHLMRDDVNSYLEMAVDYGNCGLWEEAIDITERLIKMNKEGKSTYPILYYYSAYCYEKIGDQKNAHKYYQLANQMPPDYCFPFRAEIIFVLKAAMEHNPKDAMAHYYLGNLLFDTQPEEAIKEWEISESLNANFSTLYRNLGRAYDKKLNNLDKSKEFYEKAAEMDPEDSRIIYELDNVYKKSQESPHKRLAFLQKHHNNVVKSEYLTPIAREIELYVLLGNYNKALELLSSFHIRRAEGGFRAGHSAYLNAHLLRGIQHMNKQEFDKALADFNAAGEYPLNMEAAHQFANDRAIEVMCYKGVLYESMGKKKKAKEAYESALKERINDNWGEHMYFRGYALKRLNNEDEANSIFKKMIEHGENNLKSIESSTGISFFAKFGSKSTNAERKAAAHYQIGLGMLGLGQITEARTEFETAAKLDVNHLWSRAKINEIDLMN